ncbi:hypothetical protein QR685DRAFT_598825 [Neurospora intermedia]|uniref:Uncharacterized protein n=1 Tax=Neurospora intermedia TaxID=5142 RepID=A0ABR3D989_NEUIN
MGLGQLRSGEPEDFTGTDGDGEVTARIAPFSSLLTSLPLTPLFDLIIFTLFCTLISFFPSLGFCFWPAGPICLESAVTHHGHHLSRAGSAAHQRFYPLGGIGLQVVYTWQLSV